MQGHSTHSTCTQTRVGSAVGGAAHEHQTDGDGHACRRAAEAASGRTARAWLIDGMGVSVLLFFSCRLVEGLPKPGTMGLATGSGAAGVDVAWSEEMFGLALLEEEENLVPASRAPG